MPGLNTEDAAWIGEVIGMLEEFRKFNKEATVSRVITFLMVAREPGINPQEAYNRLGYERSGTNRVAMELTAKGWGGKPGWGILDQTPDPDDARFTRLNLAGRRLLNSVRSRVRAAGAAVERAFDRKHSMEG